MADNMWKPTSFQMSDGNVSYILVLKNDTKWTHKLHKTMQHINSSSPDHLTRLS